MARYRLAAVFTLSALVAACASPPDPYQATAERIAEQGRQEDVISQCEARVLAAFNLPGTAQFARRDLGAAFFSDVDYVGVVRYVDANGASVTRRFRCTGDDPSDIEVEMV